VESNNLRRRVVIAGGSGFLGVSLANHLLDNDFEVTILSRSPPKAKANTSQSWRCVSWDARTLGDWTGCLEGAFGLVNLVGRSVDCIKTPDHQDEILRSRVEATRVLGSAMQRLASPPPVWVQMSTAHIYGDPPRIVCDEEASYGIGMAPTVARAWEEAFHAAILPQQRGVILRTSFVLGRDRGAGAGALSRLRLLARLGLSGRIASGMQGISWIHELDLNRMFERALTDSQIHGAYISSALHPVPQYEFAKALRRSLGIPIGLPATSWMVKIGAPLFLRTDPELALYGRFVVPQRSMQEGFEFRFPHLAEALRDLHAS
jgi:uncharacterized protein (TIGR01777 family)